MAPTFENEFAELFESEFPRLFRVLDRLSGDPEMAADLAQEAFVRLYRRGSFPDTPAAWLITVSLNLHRNAQAKKARRSRLLSLVRAREVHSDPLPSPDAGADSNTDERRVREVLGRLPERDRRILLLRAEEFSYQEIAESLDLNLASIGTLLARAKNRFKKTYSEDPDAS